MEKKTRDPKWLIKYPHLTRKQAMDLFCHECMGYTKHRDKYGPSENWVSAGMEAAQCTDGKCPLYPYRPKTTKKLPDTSEGIGEDLD